MNFLAHHAVARRVRPDAAPEFYVGNLLPDLLGLSGEGRIRSGNVVPETPFTEGIALHLATDQQFHSSPLFKEICAEASQLLRDTPFTNPPRRVFFVAHVFVELALDAAILHSNRENPPIVEHLYDQFDQVDLAWVAAETGNLLGANKPLPQLSAVLEGFTRNHYLYEYGKSAGLAEALRRINRRLRTDPLNEVPNFSDPTDLDYLAGAFKRFAPRAIIFAETILSKPVFL